MPITLAALYEERTRRVVYLRGQHLFGRNPGRADTVLHHPGASQIHASIRWDGQHWCIADHSKNGTYIEGKRLLPNAPCILSVGQKVEFLAHAGDSWRVLELAPPCPMLVPSDGGEPVVLSGTFHSLPDAQAPEALIYRDADDQWLVEREHRSDRLVDGDLVATAHRAWRFAFAEAVGATQDVLSGQPRQTGPVHFTFNVSQNEEHVRLSANVAGEVTDFGERVHHFCLLTLARRRHADALSGFDETSQGWLAVDRLAAMLKIEPAHVNIQIFRARNQINNELKSTTPGVDLVERRRGEVRCGTFPFRIFRGNTQESEFVPMPSFQGDRDEDDAASTAGSSPCAELR